jgi:hypothetical protein
LEPVFAIVREGVYHSALDDARPTGGPSRGERRFVINGFVVGCVGRISARLETLTRQSKAAAAGNSRALVVTKTAAIKATMDKAGIKLRSGRASSCRLDGNSYRAGQSAGDRASFGRPVS